MKGCKHQDDTHYEALIDSDTCDIQSPDELDRWNEEKEVLECRRETDEGELCPFHSELNVKNREKVREWLKTELKKSTEEPFLLADGGLCRIIINDITVNRPVWLIGSKFDNRFSIQDVTFEKRILIDQSRFDDILELDTVKFQSGFSIEDATMKLPTEFNSVTFEKKCKMSGVDFEEKVTFDRSRFHGVSYFQYTTFNQETRFGSCRFEDKACFKGAEFEGETKISRVRDIDDIGGANAAETRFDQDVNFKKAKFKSTADLNVKLKGDANFQQANLSDCDLSGTDLSSSNLEDANLSNSILYNADLRGSKVMGANLNNVKINSRTVFLGQPDNEMVQGYDHTVSSLVRDERCYYDPKAEFREDKNEDTTDEELRTKARIVYRELQDLGSSASHSQLQTRAFIRRKDMQKDLYWEDIWSTEDGITQPLVAGVRWLKASASRTLMLYGESPWRLMFWSIISIVSFALSYILFGLIEGANGVVNVGLADIIYNPTQFITALTGSFYYSALIFTNLSFGRYSPVGAGTYLTAIETMLGLTMLALFFFVLGRRASK